MLGRWTVSFNEDSTYHTASPWGDPHDNELWSKKATHHLKVHIFAVCGHSGFNTRPVQCASSALQSKQAEGTVKCNFSVSARRDFDQCKFWWIYQIIIDCSISGPDCTYCRRPNQIKCGMHSCDNQPMPLCNALQWMKTKQISPAKKMSAIPGALQTR